MRKQRRRMRHPTTALKTRITVTALKAQSSDVTEEAMAAQTAARTTHTPAAAKSTPSQKYSVGLMTSAKPPLVL